MNLISNNCLGAYTYQLLNMEYNNPFMWSTLTYNDMRNLIYNWDTINWFNTTIHLANNLPTVDSTFYKQHTYYLNIDRKFNIWYPHYRNSTTHPTPTVIGIDVYHNEIWNYIIEKYVARVKRMLTLAEKPFIYLMYAEKHFQLDSINGIIQICNETHTPYMVLHNEQNGILHDNNAISVNTNDVKLCAKQGFPYLDKIMDTSEYYA